MKIVTAFILFAVLCSNVFGQSEEIDSLKSIAATASHDSTRIKTYFNIGESFKNNLPDSAIKYFNIALAIAEKNSENRQFQWYKWNIYKGLGFSYFLKDNFKKGIEYYQKQIAVATAINDIDGIVRGYNNIGVIYQNQGDYPESFAYYIKAIKIAEKNNDKWMLGLLNNNIAAIYLVQSDFKKTIQYCRTALKYYELTNDTIRLAHTYSNMGASYSNLNKLDSALYYINLSNKIFEQTNFVNEKSINAQNEALIYSQKKDYKKAIECFNRAYSLQKQLGNTIRISNILSLKAQTFISMYNNSDKNMAYINKAHEISTQALHIADSLDLEIGKINATIALYMVDSIRGNYKGAFTKLSLLYYYQNKIVGNTSIDQLETRFLMEKKQQEVNMLEEKNALASERARLMQIITIISIFSIVILIVSVFLIIRRLKITQHQKLIIQDQNNKLFEQNEEITTQKEEIEKHRKSIVDSITYAKRIQQAVLPKFPKTDTTIDHFVLFMPKDIVSGDFYWFSKIDDKIIFTVADCTGHGVPGGFMSMLGVSFLNEIVNGKQLLPASQIINKLRDLVMASLQQKGERNEAKDGMDIALCILNTTTNELEFAGAFNSLFIIPADESGIQTIKGDRQPIAYYNKMKPFTNHHLQLQKGDCIYLSSDGFKDQFDADGNKFGVKRFDNLLTSISAKSMDQQKVELEHVLRVWLQDTVQIDDVTVLGIRI